MNQAIKRYFFCTFSLFYKVFLCGILLSSSQAYAYRFVVYADSRAPKGDPNLFNREVLAYINSRILKLDPKPDFVLFLGDTVNRGLAADGHNNLADWKKFMKAGLKGIPLFVAIGNTDLYGNSGWTEYPVQALYQSTFDYLPDNGPPNYKKLAYSFEFGEKSERSLFVVLDSFGFFESSGNMVNFDNGFDGEQIAWFYDVSSSSKAKHKFAFSHGPAFSIEGFPVNETVKVMWNMMEEFNYDLFFCGHEHIYSRWCIDKSTYPLAIRKLTQVIAGSAGAAPDDISKVVVDKEKAHIYSGYTFAVLDVKGKEVKQKTYAAIPNGIGGFACKKIDRYYKKTKNLPIFNP